MNGGGLHVLEPPVQGRHHQISTLLQESRGRQGRGLPREPALMAACSAAGGCSVPIDCHILPRLTRCWWLQLPYRLPHLSICVLSATARPGDPRCVCSRPLSQLWWQTMGPPVPAPVKGARVERGSFLLGPKTPTGR